MLLVPSDGRDLCSGRMRQDFVRSPNDGDERENEMISRQKHGGRIEVRRGQLPNYQHRGSANL